MARQRDQSDTKTTKSSKITKASSIHGRLAVFVSFVVLVSRDRACDEG